MVLYALIASLPYLKRDDAPSISAEDLDSSAESFLNAKQFAEFKKLSLTAAPSDFPKNGLAAARLLPRKTRSNAKNFSTTPAGTSSTSLKADSSSATERSASTSSNWSFC